MSLDSLNREPRQTAWYSCNAKNPVHVKHHRPGKRLIFPTTPKPLSKVARFPESRAPASGPSSQQRQKPYSRQTRLPCKRPGILETPKTLTNVARFPESRAPVFAPVSRKRQHSFHVKDKKINERFNRVKHHINDNYSSPSSTSCTVTR